MSHGAVPPPTERFHPALAAEAAPLVRSWEQVARDRAVAPAAGCDYPR